MPMNFSVIGGGGGGPLGADGTGAVTGGVGRCDIGGGGGAFGLNRNTFRSASIGAGRSPSSDSSFTSGAAIAGDCALRACAPVLLWLDGAGPLGDVPALRKAR